MAKKMLIVHGYSDGSVSFTDLRDFFVAQKLYDEKDVYLLDYASMDDEATFRDFADKLDDDYNRIFKGERIDVACHSTGALVVRTWLVLRRETQKALGQRLDCPVEHLLMFAPANFGSDLAELGQSFLGKIRSTFFNSNRRPEDFLESGKAVLQGLEPASPFQWGLSQYDLFQDNYFNPKLVAPDAICFPFVLAAGNNYGGSFESRIVKNRAKPGTDGTVRICGTSLNARKLMVAFESDNTVTHQWAQETKFKKIPFAVFNGFNHSSVIDPKRREFVDQIGPGRLALEALKVKTVSEYEQMAKEFDRISKENYDQMTDECKDKFQQFFFRVRDDVDYLVEDFFLDFVVLDKEDNADAELTEEFDNEFESKFYTHSEDKAHRVMMVNYDKMTDFFKKLADKKAKLAFNIKGKAPLPDVSYGEANCIVFDGAKPDPGGISFFFPNTTTLVDIILNRIQTDRLLNVKPSADVGKGARPTLFWCDRGRHWTDSKPCSEHP